MKPTNGEGVVVRKDPFMPYLQQLIQRKQNERTRLLNDIQSLDEEIEVLQYERDHRDMYSTAIPDFPKDLFEDAEVHSDEEIPHEIPMVEEALVAFAQAAPAPRVKKPGGGGGVHPDNYKLHPNLQDVPFKSTMFKDISYNLVRSFVVEWAQREGMKTWFRTRDIVRIARVPASVASKRLRELQDEAIVEWNGVERGGSKFRYKKPEPGAFVPRPRVVPPERDKPAYADAPHRGEPVRLVDTGKKGTQMQVGGRGRTKAKAKDRAYAAAQAAVAARAEAQKSKAQKAPKWKRNK